jgi:alpha-amylase
MRHSLLALTLLFANGIASADPISHEPSRSIYQIYVRAFYDGSLAPDGEGDFAGLTAKADYFNELGIDTLLLMPIFSSTGGMGYIPRNYFTLDNAYGAQEDFVEFLDAMHSEGIKIILDAPVNHISFDSEWFEKGSKKSCSKNSKSEENEFCDYFYFIENPCETLPYGNWHKPWHWNTTDCTAVWFQHPDYDPQIHKSEAVYATFFNVMPDLKFWDFDNNSFHEPVVNKIQEFFNHWTSLGVDGFRIDAAKHFVEGRDNKNPQEPMNLALLERWLTGARVINPDVSFLGEIWASHDQFEPYLDGSLDMVLDFPFMEAVRSSSWDHYGERYKNVLKHFENTQEDIKPGARVVFAGNHDVSRMLTEWQDDQNRLRMAHFLTFTTPHTPLLYYGEELGMHGRVKRPDATSDVEYVRTINAFPWHGRDESVGFPGGITPVTKPADNYQTNNLELAKSDADSVWNMIRQLLQLRKSFGISQNTKLKVRDDLYGHVIGFSMYDSLSGNCRMTIVNFSSENRYTVPVTSPEHCTGRPGAKFAEGARLAGGDLMLEPNGKAIIDFIKSE